MRIVFIFIRYTYARTDNRTNTCTGHHQTARPLCYFDIINGHKPCIVTRRTCQDFQEKQKRHCTKQDIKDSKAMNKLPKACFYVTKDSLLSTEKHHLHHGLLPF